MVGPSAFRFTTFDSSGGKGFQERDYPSMSAITPASAMHINTMRSQASVWPALSPEIRAEAMRRAQLVQLFKQINPELKLCSKNFLHDPLAPPTVRKTADKGVQVPDVRLPPFPSRRGRGSAFWRARSAFNASSEGAAVFNYRTPRLVLPGVRINTSNWSRRDSAASQRTPFVLQPAPKNLRKRTGPIGVRPRDVKLTTSSTSTSSNRPISKPPGRSSESVWNREVERGDTQQIDDSSELQEAKSSVAPTADKSANQAPITAADKEQSSGEDDMLVVVLNEPSQQRDLVRKYGQFYCRRCAHGWSSRNVWCVRDTSKVYIKQTCNGCNKIVNPYVVNEYVHPRAAGQRQPSPPAAVGKPTLASAQPDDNSRAAAAAAAADDRTYVIEGSDLGSLAEEVEVEKEEGEAEESAAKIAEDVTDC